MVFWELDNVSESGRTPAALVPIMHGVMRSITVGTRGSTLALAQTRWVVARLKEEWPETDFRIQTISTKGDRSQESLSSLAQKGNKGFWVKEIEDALLGSKIDIAVHSLKDLPTAQPGVDVAAQIENVQVGAISAQEGFAPHARRAHPRPLGQIGQPFHAFLADQHVSGIDPLRDTGDFQTVRLGGGQVF
jgi:hydroxymethylbilane synthase